MTTNVHYATLTGKSILTLGLFLWTSAAVAAELDQLPAAEMIVTIQPSDSRPAVGFQPDDLKVFQGESRRVISRVEPLAGERAAMELFIYIDDAIDSTAFEVLRPELGQFIRELPESTRVAIGNSIDVQAFTSNHQELANALRRPAQDAQAEVYSNLLDLMRNWPSTQHTGRRAVLIISDGFASEHPEAAADDNPLLEAAWRNARIHGIGFNSMFVHTGRIDAADRREIGRGNLLALTEATGGRLYEVSSSGELCSSLADLRLRLTNQYRVTFEPRNYAGTQPVRVEADAVSVTSPNAIYVRNQQASVAASR